MLSCCCIHELDSRSDLTTSDEDDFEALTFIFRY